MNELSKIQQTMSSREISDLTGKRHDHVLRDIDTLNANYEKLSLPKVGEGYYTLPNTGPQQHRCYHLTKMQTIDLMTGYNIALRIKINRRWEELEKKEQFKVPTSFREALLLAAEQQEVIEKQQLQLKEQEPQVLFAKALEVSDQNILIGQLAKLLNQNGINIGQNRLFTILRETGYLHKNGEQHNMPTQKSMDLGLFKVKTTTINNPDGSVRVTKTPKVTGKGQSYFVNKFIKK